jgi:hypothetical protein
MQPTISAALAADRHNDMLRRAALDRRAREANGTRARHRPVIAIVELLQERRRARRIERAVEHASVRVRQELRDAASTAPADPGVAEIGATRAAGSLVPCPAVQLSARACG